LLYLKFTYIPCTLYILTYSEHFKAFEYVLKRKKEKHELPTLTKVKQLKDSIKILIKSLTNSRKGNKSFEQQQRNIWTSKLRFQGIVLTRYLLFLN